LTTDLFAQTGLVFHNQDSHAEFRFRLVEDGPGLAVNIDGAHMTGSLQDLYAVDDTIAGLAGTHFHHLATVTLLHDGRCLRRRDARARTLFLAALIPPGFGGGNLVE